MKFTRARDLVIACIVTVLLISVILVVSYDSIPQLPRLAGITLAVLAIVEALPSLPLRTRIRAMTAGARPPQPTTMVRVVALAKASSMLGAIMCGAWIAVVIYVLPRRDRSIVAASDTTTALIGLVCAVLLIAAALWLEFCCKTPSDRRKNELLDE